MHFFFYLFLFVITFAKISIGSDLKNENIKWHDPIIKFVSNNHKVTSGYLTIENNGDRDLILKSVFSNISEITEIHSMIVKDDIMKMEKVIMPILIPKGKKLIFKSGGLHIMFMKLKRKLMPNDKEIVIFEFENQGKIEVLMKIKKIGLNKHLHH